MDEAERWAFGKDARYFGFCYDLIPIDHPEWLFPPDPLDSSSTSSVSRGLHHPCCASPRHTRSDFVRNYPDYGAERVQVLRLGADAVVNIALSTTASRAILLFDGEPYAVYCATIDRRKNHQLIYRVAKGMARGGVAGNSHSSARPDRASTTSSTASVTTPLWRGVSLTCPNATTITLPRL